MIKNRLSCLIRRRAHLAVCFAIFEEEIARVSLTKDSLRTTITHGLA